MNHIYRQRQTGFNMIEVLISIVVVAIGLLGIIGLQASVARFNSSSYYRNVATTLAMDMSERLRSYQAGATEQFPTASSVTKTSACFTTSGCTRAQMSAHELAIWFEDVARMLPNGAAAICLDNNVADDDAPPVATQASPKCTQNASTEYTPWAIKIWWSDDRDGTLKRFTMVY